MRALALAAFGMLLLFAATPGRAQSLAELGAAMSINGTLTSNASANADTALRARETITAHLPSPGTGNGGWMNGSDSIGPTSGSGKSWETATSGSNGGKGGWASGGASPGGAGSKGWVTASSGGSGAGKAGGWATPGTTAGAPARHH